MSDPRTHFASTALRAAIPFAIVMSVVFTIQRGPIGLLLGLVSGVLFGLGIAVFASVQSRKYIAMRSEFSAEGLDHDGPANRGATGGWLYLTPKRLVFVPHKVNLSTSRLEIARADIVRMSLRRAKPGQRLVVETAQIAHTFSVNHRDDWGASLHT